MRSRRHVARALSPWLWLCALLGACPDGEPRTPAQRDACNLTAGHLIARDDTSHYDGQALLTTGADALAVWSNALGTFSRRLNADGKPLAPALRVADRCEGGVALAGRSDARWLGCLRPQHGAYVLTLDERGAVVHPEYLGKAGRDSRGIALVARDRGWVSAWHDGTPGAYGVWLAEAPQGEPETAQLLSHPSFAASAPALALDGPHWVLTWSEMRFDRSGSSSTRMALKREDAPVTAVGETPVQQPDPQLVVHGERRWLGFRSKHSGDRQSQLYVVPLSPRLKPLSKPIRVGRANTLTQPSVLDCGNHRFASMSRMYGGERYLALHPLDDSLKSLGGGYQYYANARDYLGVASACQADGMLLLAAERTPGLGDAARLMAAALRCQ